MHRGGLVCLDGSGAKFWQRLINEGLRPGIGSGGKHCIPDRGRRVVLDAKPSELELTFSDPMYDYWLRVLFFLAWETPREGTG
jgi:hypothetical protein